MDLSFVGESTDIDTQENFSGLSHEKTKSEFAVLSVE